MKRTCARRPTPSSACRGGWTAARTRWPAGTRSSCVFDTPVGTDGRRLRPGGCALVQRDGAFDVRGAVPNLSDVDPALDEPRPDVRPEPPLLQDGADHAGRHRVELRDGGADGGGAALAVLLVPLRPGGAQAVVRDDPLEQQLTPQKQAGVSTALVQPSPLPVPAPTSPPPHSLRPCRSAARPPGRPQRTGSCPGPQAPLRRRLHGRMNRCHGNCL